MTSVTQSLLVSTIQTLVMDAVREANSGHPGAPMALTPIVMRTRSVRKPAKR